MELLNQPNVQPNAPAASAEMVPPEAIVVCPEAVPFRYPEGGMPPGSYREPMAPHQGTLILVLGILSFFVVPFILGPIAWALGSSNLAAMRAGRMDPSGRDMTNAGRVCGMVATILGIIAVVIGIVLLIVLLSAIPSIPVGY
jgi:hypothetical protein